MIDILKLAITKASQDLHSNKLIYNIDFNFGWPSQSLKVKEVELLQNVKYDLNFEWGRSIGEEELNILEHDGFLKKTSEFINEYDPLEKTIEYDIVIPNVG